MSNKYTKIFLASSAIGKCRSELQKSWLQSEPLSSGKQQQKLVDMRGGKKPYALLTELEMEADTIDTRKEGP